MTPPLAVIKGFKEMTSMYYNIYTDMTGPLEDEMETYFTTLDEDAKPTELDNLQPIKLPTELFDIKRSNQLVKRKMFKFAKKYLLRYMFYIKQLHVETAPRGFPLRTRAFLV